MDKVYLGDGVYAEYDGYQVWLTTPAGLGGESNRIAINPDVFIALAEYAMASDMVVPTGGDQP